MLSTPSPSPSRRNLSQPLCDQGAVEKGVPLLTHSRGPHILLLRQVQALPVQVVVDSCTIQGWIVTSVSTSANWRGSEDHLTGVMVHASKQSWLSKLSPVQASGHFGQGSKEPFKSDQNDPSKFGGWIYTPYMYVNLKFLVVSQPSDVLYGIPFRKSFFIEVGFNVHHDCPCSRLTLVSH